MSETWFWRSEIWHPLTLHFPIALLLLGTITKLIALLVKSEKALFWHRAASYLLYIGCAGAWLSIYTGNLAEGSVSRKICDPTILKYHQIYANYLAYLFSAATVLDGSQYLRFIQVKPKLIGLVVFLLMLTGSGFLIYTSHLGAHVVYQQAGGVQVPSADCAEFK